MNISKIMANTLFPIDETQGAGPDKCPETNLGVLLARALRDVADLKINCEQQEESMNNQNFSSAAQPSMQTLQMQRGVNLDVAHNKLLADFSAALSLHRFWHVLPAADGEPVAFFDSQTGVRYTLSEFDALCNTHPFLYVNDKSGNYLATLHTTSGHLWACLEKNQHLTLVKGKSLSEESRVAGLQGWRLPTKEQFWPFASAEGNPHREGQKFRLYGTSNWLTAGGCCDVDEGCWGVGDGCWGVGDGAGKVFACNLYWLGTLAKQRLSKIMKNEWLLTTPDGKMRYAPDTSWQGLTPEALLTALRTAGLGLQSADKSFFLNSNLAETFVDVDYTPCRLPKLESAQLRDPHKGLWELWGTRTEVFREAGLVARDPARDVCARNVAIDFGTSSTVVALTDEHGGRRLLRIGVRDFYQEARSTDFENPTVLEIIDYARLAEIWTAQTYRPALDWNWIHAAHEAQASFRDNPGDTAVLASILPRIKQWALRSARESLRITDRQGYEIEVPALTERNPVSGTPMTAGTDDPFDPVELYAWFLGMAINWRGNGLFLKYHLTFPVKYPREVKDKILASFRRGLQRSLPPTLVTQPGALQPFSVIEIASEPAAYAAAALPHLDLEPHQDSIPYAVFDFGGGTSDFDFGLWRWASTEEESEGYDQVFEHLHSAGDNYLGGENLLEHLVYASFRQNLAVCREHKIHFTRPLDGERFTGEEAFVHRTQAAQTNTVLLAGKLRNFLESAEPRIEPQLKIDLLDSEGKKQPCELSLDAEALDKLLFDSMQRGVRAFLGELAKIRNELPTGQPIQILLAGNGSRSRHIKSLFDPEGEHWPRLLQECLGDNAPDLKIHAPLPIDEKNHHAPTAKTGVALGLLRLCKGEGVKLIDHVRSATHDEAPFGFYVGRLGRREEFSPVLTPASAYQQWHLLGPLPQGVFKLCFSCSPRAQGGMRQGDPELRVERLDFPAAAPQDKLFARATGPSTIELAAAPDEASLHSRGDLPRQTRDLETR